MRRIASGVLEFFPVFARQYPFGGRLFAEIASGGLAQLGERLHGMQEVRGSSPLSSTRFATPLGIPNDRLITDRGRIELGRRIGDDAQLVACERRLGEDVHQPEPNLHGRSISTARLLGLNANHAGVAQW